MKTPTSKPATMSVATGSRVRWDGDYANDPGAATVTSVGGPFMSLSFDDGRILPAVPVALLGGPRWHVIPAPVQTQADRDAILSRISADARVDEARDPESYWR